MIEDGVINPVEIRTVSTPHREINTALPCKDDMAVLADIARFESRSMQGQFPIVWDRAEGFNIYDSCGNKWIDFTSTIFVTNVGHANRNVLDAVKSAMEKPIIHSYAYANKLRAEYQRALVDFAGAPFEKAFLLSAGTEATEAGLKLMRMYGQKKGKRNLGIICIEGNWHGRTMGAQLMSSNKEQKSWIGMEDPHMHHLRFPYPWDVDEAAGASFFEKEIQALQKAGIDLSQDICGFMLETFQGWGAVFYPKSFIQAIEQGCREYDILLCFDEMQAGFGRTGRRFGYEHYEVTPDLICCGKGMGSGFPLSGVLGRTDVMDLPGVGNMSSTHSANPIVCAAGLATIAEIDRLDLVNESARKGALLHSGLNAIRAKYSDRILFVLGEGMIAALILRDPATGKPDGALATAVSRRCLEKGLLTVHTGRESIKIGPPLVISDDALLEGISVIEESLAEVLVA